MAKVEIDTPGVTIRIEADDPLDDVKAAARELFHECGGWPHEKVGPASGFQLTERRWTGEFPRSSMDHAPRLGFDAESPNTER